VVNWNKAGAACAAGRRRLSRANPLRLSPCARPPRRAFTLVEMLATVAALIIVLGLMVSLARYVRGRAADQLTKDLLVKLDALAAAYHERYGAWPAAAPFVGPADATGPTTGIAGTTDRRADPSLPDEAALLRAARANNREIVARLRALTSSANPPAPARRLGGVPLALSEDELRDAWGRPIVYMPGMRPPFGPAPGNRPFFLSAGPDGRFSTLLDNVYSYERAEEEPALSDVPAVGESPAN
jgi:hypothetical protein